MDNQNTGYGAQPQSTMPPQNNQPQYPQSPQNPPQNPVAGGGNAGAPPNGNQPTGVTLNSDFEPEQPRKKSSLMVVGGIFLFLVLVLAGGAILYFSSGFASNENMAQANQSPDGSVEPDTEAGSAMQPVPIPSIDPENAFVQHTVNGVAGDEGATATVGEPVEVALEANSKGADVNGYDLLIPYDKTSFEITNVVSLKDSFEVYPKDREDYYSVTGIKLLNETDPTPFENEPIIQFEIVPKQAGELYIDVMAERGKETTKFVDANVQLIKPQIKPIKITVTE